MKRGGGHPIEVYKKFNKCFEAFLLEDPSQQMIRQHMSNQTLKTVKTCLSESIGNIASIGHVLVFRFNQFLRSLESLT